jgi:Formate hydrogenlyase subunit 3/Multisubunit Na+/H+ antiporter, MnhD subunit
MTGIVATSIYFLAVILIYSAFGSLNMADIALKLRDPSAQIPFSRGITGDIVLTSKVAFSLMTWVFLFKTGILPIGFTWQPHAYSEAPIPVSAGFTAIADTVGIYLFMRFFGTILGKDVIQELAEFRVMLLAFVQVLTIISAFTSALLMVAEKDAKKFITYSTISQFSLALLGFTLDNVFGVASTILLLISNTLGDATLFYLTGLSIVRCGRSVACLAALKGNNSALFSLVITVLNLFGIIPIVLGFWGKVLLVLAGLNRSVVIPVTILVVSGISAIGYFRLVHAVYTSHLTTRDDPRSKNITIPVTMVLILGMAIIVLGSCFALYEPFRGFVMEISNDLLSNYGEYVNRSIGMEIR